MRESEVEAYLVKRVKELGGEIRKVKWIGRRGAPDRYVILYGGFFIEVKSPGERLRDEQKKEIKRLMQHGVSVWVADTPTRVDMVLEVQSGVHSIPQTVIAAYKGQWLI